MSHGESKREREKEKKVTEASVQLCHAFLNEKINKRKH